MSTYSEQVNIILQTKLVPQMQSLSMDVAKYEPYSYTSTTLEDRKRQLDYYSMIYDFLSEYVTGAEELTNAKLINVIRLLDPPTRERKATNYLNISNVLPNVLPGFELFLGENRYTSQTVIEPGTFTTITIYYTPAMLVTGTKSMELQSPAMVCDGYTLVVPNYYIPFELGGTSLVLYITASGNEFSSESRTFTIPINYMTDRTFYYGVGAPGLGASQIQALTSFIAEKSDKTLTFSPNSQIYYFAYPATYGYLTTILDHNGFDMTSDFAVDTISFTLVAPNYPTGTQDYYVYSYDLPTIQNNFNITFKF
jgi:hypothetical protein